MPTESPTESRDVGVSSAGAYLGICGQSPTLFLYSLKSRHGCALNTLQSGRSAGEAGPSRDDGQHEPRWSLAGMADVIGRALRLIFQYVGPACLVPARSVHGQTDPGSGSEDLRTKGKISTLASVNSPLGRSDRVRSHVRVQRQKLRRLLGHGTLACAKGAALDVEILAVGSNLRERDAKVRFAGLGTNPQICAGRADYHRVGFKGFGHEDGRGTLRLLLPVQLDHRLEQVVVVTFEGGELRRYGVRTQRSNSSSNPSAWRSSSNRRSGNTTPEGWSSRVATCRP